MARLCANSPSERMALTSTPCFGVSRYPRSSAWFACPELPQLRKPTCWCADGEEHPSWSRRAIVGASQSTSAAVGSGMRPFAGNCAVPRCRSGLRLSSQTPPVRKVRLQCLWPAGFISEPSVLHAHKSRFQAECGRETRKFSDNLVTPCTEMQQQGWRPCVFSEFAPF
jgi:hypothetical protein